MIGTDMGDGLLAVIVLGLIAGGAIVVIDSLILRRVRRHVQPERDEDT